MGLIKAMVFKLYSWMQGHEGVADAHHTKYTDSDARGSIDNIFNEYGLATGDISMASHKIENLFEPSEYADCDTLGARNDAITAHKNVAAAHHTKYTDAEVDAILAVHSALPSVHHTKYTDAEAVAAISTEDVYVKNTGDVIQADNPVLEIISDAAYPQIDEPQGFSFHKSGATPWYQRNYFGLTTNSVNYPPGVGGGMKVWIGNSTQDCLLDFFNYLGIASKNTNDFSFTTKGGAGVGFVSRLEITGNITHALVKIKESDLDMENNVIKDQKNHVASALSGTKKLVEIDIGGTPYYYEVYPTKA